MSNFSDDPVESQVLLHLGKLAQGFDPRYGGAISQADQMEAGRRYVTLREQQRDRLAVREAASREHELAQQVQNQSHDVTTKRLQIEVAIEHRKLDLEAERVEVAKAEVMLRAMEMAARNPDLKQLTDVVQEMSFRLLGREALPAIEDKSGE